VEEDGLGRDGHVFRYEFNPRTLQDPKLAKWWAKAAEFRSSGTAPPVGPAPWDGTAPSCVSRQLYGEAHEQITCPRKVGRPRYLEIVPPEAIPVLRGVSAGAAGAWETLMIDESECFLLWDHPTWSSGLEFEKAQRSHPSVIKWKQRPRGDRLHLRSCSSTPRSSPFRTRANRHARTGSTGRTERGRSTRE